MISLSPEQEEQLTRRKLLVVFDRDGTLAPITSDPLGAPVPPIVREQLRDLSVADQVTVGILSARSCTQLAQDFGAQNLILGGNYGLEIKYPHGSKYVHPAAHNAFSTLEKVKMRLDAQIYEDWRTILEDHGLTLCWHWHMTPESQRQMVHDTLDNLRQEFPHLLFQSLPTSYEIWPMVEWDKAKGLDLMEAFVEANPESWQYVYAGDSERDEPAFEWVNRRGGISIKVGGGVPTLAQWTLANCQELSAVITQLIGLRQRAVYG
jgi:trehalose 6-phosphate phosphatase